MKWIDKINLKDWVGYDTKEDIVGNYCTVEVGGGELDTKTAKTDIGDRNIIGCRGKTCVACWNGEVRK